MDASVVVVQLSFYPWDGYTKCFGESCAMAQWSFPFVFTEKMRCLILTILIAMMMSSARLYPENNESSLFNWEPPDNSCGPSNLICPDLHSCIMPPKDPFCGTQAVQWSKINDEIHRLVLCCSQLDPSLDLEPLREKEYGWQDNISIESNRTNCSVQLVGVHSNTAKCVCDASKSEWSYLDLILTILVFLFIAFGLALGIGWCVLWKNLRNRNNVSTGINDRLATGQIFDLDGGTQEPNVRRQERVPFRPRSASIRRRILAQVERLRQELLDLDTFIDHPPSKPIPCPKVQNDHISKPLVTIEPSNKSTLLPKSSTTCATRSSFQNEPIYYPGCKDPFSVQSQEPWAPIIGEAGSTPYPHQDSTNIPYLEPLGLPPMAFETMENIDLGPCYKDNDMKGKQRKAKGTKRFPRPFSMFIVGSSSSTSKGVKVSDLDQSNNTSGSNNEYRDPYSPMSFRDKILKFERNVAKDTAIKYQSSGTACRIDVPTKHDDPKDFDQGPTPV